MENIMTNYVLDVDIIVEILSLVVSQRFSNLCLTEDEK